VAIAAQLVTYELARQTARARKVSTPALEDAIIEHLGS